MFLDHNWNAVCYTNTILTFLTADVPEKDRDLVLDFSLEHLKLFLSGFNEDGYCREGPSYFGYGFGHYTYVSWALYEASEHKIKVLIVPDNPVDEGINKACEIANRYGTEIMQISKNLHFEIGRTRLDFYVNEKAVKELSEDNLNNASVVMIAENSDGTSIFTGDIEEETENFLADRGLLPEADVLQVAHHGANTGTLDKNISIISPEYAIISVGENNSYGHPSKRVLETLENAGATVCRNDLSGAIRVTLRKGTVRVWQKLKT